MVPVADHIGITGDDDNNDGDDNDDDDVTA
jgi:hypothetical protein